VRFVAVIGMGGGPNQKVDINPMHSRTLPLIWIERTEIGFPGVRGIIDLPSTSELTGSSFDRLTLKLVEDSVDPIGVEISEVQQDDGNAVGEHRQHQIKAEVQSQSG